MNLPKEERNRRRNERLKKKRRADGINPRPPAMTKEERKTAGVVAARRYRARQSASHNPVAAIGQTNSGVQLSEIMSDEQRVAIADVVAELALLPVASIRKVEQAVRKARLSVAVKEPAESRVGGVAADIVADPPVSRRSEAAKLREVKRAAQRRVEDSQKHVQKGILERAERKIHNAELQERIARLIEKKAAASSLRQPEPVLEQTPVVDVSSDVPAVADVSSQFLAVEADVPTSNEEIDIEELIAAFNEGLADSGTEERDAEDERIYAALLALGSEDDTELPEPVLPDSK